MHCRGRHTDFMMWAAFLDDANALTHTIRETCQYLWPINGHAFMIVYTDRFKPNEILGRAMIIHEWPDDFRTQLQEMRVAHWLRYVLSLPGLFWYESGNTGCFLRHRIWISLTKDPEGFILRDPFHSTDEVFSLPKLARTASSVWIPGACRYCTCNRPCRIRTAFPICQNTWDNNRLPYSAPLFQISTSNDTIYLFRFPCTNVNDFMLSWVKQR